MPVTIALSYHSINNDIVNQLNLELKDLKIETFLLSESKPETLNERSKIIQVCSAFIAVVSRDFQKTVSCMELVNYSKDLKKKIIIINPNKTYTPFGALGAISSSSELGLLQINDNKTLEQCFEQILNYLTNQRPKSSKQQLEIKSSIGYNEAFNLNHTNIETDVLISYNPEALGVLQLIKIELDKNKIKYLAEESTNNRSSVTTSKVLVVIMSKQYEDNDFARLIVETAKLNDKPIIPVSVSKSVKPDKWLGLVIAGKLYYRIFDEKQAYEQQYDTTPINNFIYGVKIALADRPTASEIEKADIEFLNKKIEECKSKLKTWPPKVRDRQKKYKKPSKVVLEQPKLDMELSYTHYTVTRIDFVPPKPLFDSYGVPLRNKFDIMLSYQWNHQNLVREIYMNLNMRNFKMWFDIWGGIDLEGNSNDAMATAIESSKVILLFLSQEYQSSTNCLMELKYALACNKPIVFIIVEDLKIEPWIQEVINSNYQFTVKSISDLSVVHNNISKFDTIAHAIRAIAGAQPDIDDNEISDEAFNLKQLLNDALDEIAENNGKSRFKTCNRCKKDYEEENPIGCKKHTAYYMGGSIIAGRWVCCNQTDKNAIGCANYNHTDVKLKWYQDPNYGTYNWVPE